MKFIIFISLNNDFTLFTLQTCCEYRGHHLVKARLIVMFHQANDTVSIFGLCIAESNKNRKAVGFNGTLTFEEMRKYTCKDPLETSSFLELRYPNWT